MKDQSPRLATDPLITAILGISTVNELCIAGGEPLLFKEEIYRILSGISKTNIRTVVITNGVLMDSRFIDSISSFNIHLVVSIDTLDHIFWKFVRGIDSYHTVLGNLEYALKQLTSNKLSIQSVLSEETRFHVESVSEYARDKNIYHSIQNYISTGFEGSWTEIEFDPTLRPTLGQQCFAAGKNISIMQNGDVYTCFQQNLIPDCEKPIGNLHYQRIEEILCSEYLKRIFDKMTVCNMPCKVLKCNTKS
jgi:sulfatase maturation enzyme AslB (radical SAM superfamily)